MPRSTISLSTKIIQVLFISTFASLQIHIIWFSSNFPIHVSDLHKVTTPDFLIRLRHMHLPSSFDSRPNGLPIIQTWGYLKWYLSPHFWSCTETARGVIVLDLEAAVQRFWINAFDDNIAEVSFDALHCAATALVVSFPFVKLLLAVNMSSVAAHDVSIQNGNGMKTGNTDGMVAWIILWKILSTNILKIQRKNLKP